RRDVAYDGAAGADGAPRAEPAPGQDGRAGADERALAGVDRACEMDTRRERHEVLAHRVVRDRAADVHVDVIAEPDVSCHDRPRSDHHAVPETHRSAE